LCLASSAESMVTNGTRGIATTVTNLSSFQHMGWSWRGVLVCERQGRVVGGDKTGFASVPLSLCAVGERTRSVRRRQTKARTDQPLLGLISHVNKHSPSSLHQNHCSTTSRFPSVMRVSNWSTSALFLEWLSPWFLLLDLRIA